jgi:hypothetical protein
MTAYVIVITSGQGPAPGRRLAAPSPTKSPLPCDRMLNALPAYELVCIGRELGLKGLSERMGCEALLRRIAAAA